jgi:hypothetical protein
MASLARRSRLRAVHYAENFSRQYWIAEEIPNHYVLQRKSGGFINYVLQRKSGGFINPKPHISSPPGPDI